ncbi:MAG: hypothetical protein IKV97_02765 [Clostridia bacterium]|nr:hypothetical protein [Clostridia bacterium]
MKLRSFGESRTSAARIIFIIAVFVVALAAFVTRLLTLQVAESEHYKELAAPKNEKTVLVQTTRGEIVDRNGEKLVTNRGTYSIVLNRSLLPRGQENKVILDLLAFFDKHYITLPDIMPAEQAAPYRFIQPEDSAGKRYLRTFLRNTEKTENEIYGTALYEFCLKRYGAEKLSDITSEELRRLMGLRYAMEANDFSVAVPYTLIQNADVILVSELSERLYTLPGVEITVESTRHYPGGSLAAHLLGRIGPIYAEEAEKYKAMGYALDEIVGKDGAELAFEQYLKSSDGYKTVEYSADGEDILSEKVSEKYPPVYGKTVVLTISAGMQRAAEEALKKTVDSINIQNIRNGNPNRASGAVVVMDPDSGAVYAEASYPTYDQNTYRDTISDMLTDNSRPLLNRAVNGIYPPGSTFKIATAAAALHHGIVDENTRFYDSGIYREYEDYQPHCWHFDKYGTAHGWQNVVDAITNSCNYYFFEVGRLLGLERLNEYASKLGLGEKTGIETGEETGILAGDKYRASIGLPWNPGDLIQSAIGQSDNSFTPIQLASFFSTVVNGGTRYKAHVLKEVRDFGTGEAVVETSPQILDTVEISDKNLEILKRGMRSVVEDGTAASVFVNYPHSVGGKTGTAQRGKGDDNTVFAGFAPYDSPEVVVSVVIEAGVHSYTAASVAKAVFDYYFANTEEFSE